MMRTPLLTGLAIMLAASVVQPPAAAQQQSLVPFEIKDQFGRPHRHSDYADKLVILIGSNREGSRFHDAWESALRDSLGTEQFAFVSVADVRGVPFFLKGSVRSKFTRDENKPILLDWSGYLAKTYAFEPGSANILVFGVDGTLAGRAHGREINGETLSAVLNPARSLISGAGSADHLPPNAGEPEASEHSTE